MVSLLAPLSLLTPMQVIQAAEPPSLELLLFLAESESSDDELLTPLDLADLDDQEDFTAHPTAFEEDVQ